MLRKFLGVACGVFYTSTVTLNPDQPNPSA